VKHGVGRDEVIALRRIYAILAALVALSLVTAPIGAAMAAAHATMAVGSEQSIHIMNDDASVDHADMPGMGDCAKMVGSTHKPKCPCCDIAVPCSADLCLAKCFKLFGTEELPRALSRLKASLQRPFEPERPPDWVTAPQLPPPRS